MTDNGKKNDMRLKIKKGDFVVAVLVLLLAAVVAFLLAFAAKNSGSGMAVIYQNGKVIREINLNEITEPIRIAVDGEYHNVIVAENGRIHMETSDCPGETCVHSGWISDAGKTIVCLPNRVEIKITGESEVDAVVS